MFERIIRKLRAYKMRNKIKSEIGREAFLKNRGGFVGKNSDGTYDVNALKFKHKNSESFFGTYEESDGTIRILELIDIFLLLQNHL